MFRNSKGYGIHLENLLRTLLGHSVDEEKIVIVIPCDSTDTWTAAAYEDIENIETIADPWERIISLKKEYHGIRIPGHKKNTALYRLFIPRIVQNWNHVTKYCPSARKLEADIRQWVTKT